MLDRANFTEVQTSILHCKTIQKQYLRHSKEATDYMVSTTVEKNYGERTSLFCVVHSRGGATGHKGTRRRAAAMQC